MKFPFRRNKKEAGPSLSSEYLSAVTGARIQSKLWRSIALLASILAGTFAVTSVVLTVNLLRNLDRTKYILVPGLQKWTEAYPDRVTDEYISGLFEHVATRLSTWNYFNYESNMEEVFKRFTSPEVGVQQRENLRLSGFVKTLTDNKLSSLFKLDANSSVYKWCEALDAACGITVGREYIYSDGAPYQEQDVAYFMIGDAARPEKIKPYAVTITRVMRTDPRTATAMLEAAERGQLPANGRLSFSDKGKAP